MVRWLAVLGLLVIVFPHAAEAQRRGGRFGGSRFGSRSSSSGSRSSGSRSSSWGSSRSSGSRSSGSRSRFGTSRSSGSRRSRGSRASGARSTPTPPRRPSALGTPIPTPVAPLASRFGEQEVTQAERDARLDDNTAGVGSGVACSGLCFFLPTLLLLSWWFGYDKSKRDAERLAARQASWDEVRRISIGFDATARRALQAALDHLADTLPMETDDDRRVAAGQIAHHLEAALGGARYFTYQSVRTEGADTESTFARWANDLASRYQHERGHDASQLAAHRHEGDGLVVVSVLVATSTAMPALPDPQNPRAVVEAVHALRSLASPELFALEVTWSPAEEMDRMSSLELEQNYPELQRLDDGAAFGRVACTYCRAPYPAELGRCPACGAPGAASRNMNQPSRS